MYNILHKVYHSVRSYANRLFGGIMDIIWYMFDMIGTIAFAVSGALVGVSRKMDIFGMTVLALATAIGGYCTGRVARLFSAEFIAKYSVCYCCFSGNCYRVLDL